MSEMSQKLPNNWVHATIDELTNEVGVFRDGDWVESKDQDKNGNVIPLLSV